MCRRFLAPVPLPAAPIKGNQMHRPLRRTGDWILVLLPLLSLLILLEIRQPPGARASTPENPAGESNLTLYMPLLMRAKGPTARLDSSWVTDQSGSTQLAFLPGDGLVYRLSGTTLPTETITATLQLIQSGPCGTTQVYSETLALPPGSWQESIPSSAPGCTGIYTNTFQLDHESFSTTLEAQMVVRPLITASYSNGQGFDRCFPPSVSDMQSWWNESPYRTFNIYLGGIHFFCSQNPMDALWVHKVAEQGWTFTATWVGPQAPCSSFTHRMSPNTGQAYLEGQVEAFAAANAARQYGLFGALTIHYDVEGYFGDDACAAAVQSFMQGWTDQLHTLGFEAGGYGGACSSLISDWWDNSPPIDQVWIAHWTDQGHNPSATVWNAPCVSNSLWPNQQRLKQYAGDHVETWDGVSMGVDSNVFDTTVLDGVSDAGEFAAPPAAFAPLDANTGWLLLGSRLLWTADRGGQWQEIGPPGFRVLNAHFADQIEGWVAGWAGQDGVFSLGHTLDGGTSWRLQPLDSDGALEGLPITAAQFEILDASHQWLALKLGSGSSFSVGRLYASQDGGLTWEARSLPVGGAVVFADPDRGWVVGGPAGNQVFRTSDGGLSWQPQQLPELPFGETSLSLPEFRGENAGWMGAAVRLESGLILVRYDTIDGGITWQPGVKIRLDQDVFPAGLAALPYGSLDSTVVPRNLPQDAVRVVFADEVTGWALSLSGSCGTEKGTGCQQTWSLWWTEDGGTRWEPLPAEENSGR